MSIPQKVSAASVLTTHAHQFSGEVAVKDLPRVVEAIGGAKGAVTADLVSERRNGIARLHGIVEGTLELGCQRCNKRYDWPLETKVDLRLVFSEQEEKAALQGSEPYLVENDELPVRELVEDEVLLALPMLPRCETCENTVSAAPSTAKQKKDKLESRRDNPFAALKGKLDK